MDVVRGLVSKNKRRYKEDGFDLDLTYIYPNIIAMGFPAEKLEGVYRNHVDDVLRFLDSKHKDHYRVYNLCSERKYDGGKFHNRVIMYPFDDHHPPPLELIKPFCEELDVWLQAHPDNIAAIHCKAGKGRTGVMICAYLLHRGKFTDAKTCLDYYGKTRTRDGKGVTIPSQRRYVEYYGELLKHKVSYQRKTLLMTKVKFITVPQLNNGTCNVYYDVILSKTKLASSNVFEGQQSKHGSILEMPLSRPVIVCGDVCVDFFHKHPRIGKKERIFLCWFNTFFVKDEEYCKDDKGEMKRYLTLTMPKSELDKANKDKTNKIYKKEFRVVFYFEYPSEGTYISNPNGLCIPEESSGSGQAQAVQQRTSNGSIKSASGSETLGVNKLRLSDSDIKPQRPFPPSSQSVPELATLEVPVCLADPHRLHKHSRQCKVSPVGERRQGRVLQQVPSDSSLKNSDLPSTGESDDDFSESETDDEWDGCEVTSV